MTEENIAINWFSRQMKRKMEENSYKGGWGDDSFKGLLESLVEEIEELRGALINGNKQDIIDEAADVANYAMMIADNRRKQHEAHSQTYKKDKG